MSVLVVGSVALDSVETPFGKVRGKVSGHGAFAPEYDDCKALAQQTGTPLPKIMAAAQEAFLKKLF